jgi:hypothetical protein
VPVESVYVWGAHWAAAKFAEKAAQAEGEATMMSTPLALRGDAAGRNTSGEAPVTLAAAGKEITRDSATLEVCAVEALQGRLTFATAAVALHAPAVAAVVEGADQHAQEAQPLVFNAEEAQQQPPRHWLVPQSASVVQASPGELRRQEPKGGAHTAQPCRAALAVQQ